ncbi:hypothetical protein [Sphingomonas sp. PWP1-2]|uniref:hypothetical protein n=1 Tax=Sphingomonas sp. PWP1-2 TaxID=2804558 RepID=UPI003CF90AD5
MQRRLQNEGTSFQLTLDDVRAGLADHYLRQTPMTSAEIALLLGFKDPLIDVRHRSCVSRFWTFIHPFKRSPAGP